MKRKPKAWRGRQVVNIDAPQVFHPSQVYPGAYAVANCTVIPDGAPPPMAREVRRVVRAARAMFKDQDYLNYPEYAALYAALDALDRARKGKRT